MIGTKCGKRCKYVNKLLEGEKEKESKIFTRCISQVRMNLYQSTTQYKVNLYLYVQNL